MNYQDELYLANRFSADVDNLLEQRDHIEEAPISAEYQELLGIAERLASLDFSAGRPLRGRLRRELMARHRDRHGRRRLGVGSWLRLRWQAALAGLTGVRRWVLAGALIVLLTGTVALITPDIRADAAHAVRIGVEIVLQRVRVREVKPQWRWELPPSEVPFYATVAEAQQRVDFPIREPAYLPPGFRLEGVQVPNASSVSLGYRRETEERGIELIYLLQSSLAGRTDRYAEYPGEIRGIELQGRRAVWGTNKRRMDVLIWEDGDMVFVLHSTLPLAEMQKVAISLFDE